LQETAPLGNSRAKLDRRSHFPETPFSTLDQPERFTGTLVNYMRDSTREPHELAALAHSVDPVAAMISVYGGCLADVSKFYVRSPSPNGILLAPDLATLNALFAANSPPSSNLIAVPNGTKGRVLQRKFLKGGYLVAPYPANSYEMERDQAVEVALFEVGEGLQRGSKGWVHASFLHPDFWYL
jgi:hypothetical protein